MNMVTRGSFFLMCVIKIVNLKLPQATCPPSVFIHDPPKGGEKNKTLAMCICIQAAENKLLCSLLTQLRSILSFLLLNHILHLKPCDIFCSSQKLKPI